MVKKKKKKCSFGDIDYHCERIGANEEPFSYTVGRFLVMQAKCSKHKDDPITVLMKICSYEILVLHINKAFTSFDNHSPLPAITQLETKREGKVETITLLGMSGKGK